jgi:hypothetical protein
MHDRIAFLEFQFFLTDFEGRLPFCTFRRHAVSLFAILRAWLPPLSILTNPTPRQTNDAR